MDELYKSAKDFSLLFDRLYILEINKKNEAAVKIYFNKRHFHHLAGLHKLTDVREVSLKRNTASRIFDRIMKGEITIKNINKSAHYSQVEDRLKDIYKIKELLWEKKIIEFDSEKLHSKLKASMVLVNKEDKNFYHLCLAKDPKGKYYPESFFVNQNSLYLRKQKFYAIRKAIVRNNQKLILEKTYILNNRETKLAMNKLLMEGDKYMGTEQTKELIEKLEKGVLEVFDSKRYKDFLNLQSKFHRYSVNNSILIYSQRPDATHVAGFKAWKKHGRYVRKGEKGISILAPSNYKYEKDVDKIDPKTKRPMLDENGNKIKEKQTVEAMSFRKVSVFDVSQTEGKELPSLCNELTNSSLEAKLIIKAIKDVCEIPIDEENILSGAKGYYSYTDNRIAYKKGSADQVAKTLIHEYAHYKIHTGENKSKYSRETKEVQAESVAYVVANKLGVDTSSYSFEYVASWSNGKELNELKDSLSIIQSESNNIIYKLEEQINVIEAELSIKEKVVLMYENEYPAIKFIKDKTAESIIEINKEKLHTIRDIMKQYKIKGKELENSESIDKSLSQEFKTLRGIVDDFKKADVQLSKDIQLSKEPIQSLNKEISLER